MNIYEVLVIVTFVMCSIIMISQYIDSEVKKGKWCITVNEYITLLWSKSI